MKRPYLVITANIIHLLLALLLAGTSVYVLLLTRSPEILKDRDAPEAIHGLFIGAAELSVPGLFLIVAAWGMWKNNGWGWWLALVTDVAMFATLGYSMVGEKSVDLDELTLTLWVALCPILLLLPKVRRFYWETRDWGFAAKETKP